MAINYPDRYIENEIKEYEKSPKFVAEGLALKIAEEVARLLLEREMTQTQLAEAMKVSRSHVSSILNAPPNMTLLTFARLSLALGVTPDVAMYPPDESSELTSQPSGLEDDVITANDNFGLAKEYPRTIARQLANATA